MSNYLIFKNGIYDLLSHTFLHGNPVDPFIKYDYQPNYSPHLFAIHKFLSEIQPDDHERENLLLMLASFLNPTNKRVFIWTGKGNNGKSTLFNLLQNTLDAYVANFPANDEIIPIPDNLKKKKMIHIDISNEDLQSEVIKDVYGVTNNPLVTPNGLQFVFVTNDKAGVDNPDDKEFQNIFCEIKFPVLFVDNPTQPNEKQRDIEIKNKMKNWCADFMLLLLEYHKKYKKTNPS